MVQLTPTTPGSLQLVDLERTLGVFFIGYIFLMVMYGFTFFHDSCDCWFCAGYWYVAIGHIEDPVLNDLGPEVMSAQLFSDREFAHLAHSPNKAISIATFATVTAAAVLTLACLSFSRLPAPYKLDTDRFDTLVSYSIVRGVTPTLIHFALIFVFVGTSEKIYWIPFYVTSTKFFIVGAITLINSREDEQTMTHEKQWASPSKPARSATRTIGGSTIQNGITSELVFKPKSPIVIEVTQTQDDHEQNKMLGYDIAASDGDVSTLNIYRVLVED
ncbi:hypothetical protein H0H92_011821 [Tricholoma furcatifolium]|nr:hypothetical protein H0H92_011821 [Tricholoma furcatifolium]